MKLHKIHKNFDTSIRGDHLVKILLAEDDHNIATIAVMALETLGGHQVTHVPDGEAAYNKAKEESFDLVLLDEMMPKMNGLSVCKQLLSEGFTTPIIFLSAKSQATEISVLESLATGFIPKPFDPGTLSGQIQEILDKAS